MSGGQVRDDRRNTVDPARTGKPKWVPPKQPAAANNNSNNAGFGVYGPTDGGIKREADGDTDMEANKRFRGDA